MNEYLSYIILGLVQGLTEFLPVSSSGHLLLLESLGVGEPSVLNNLILHCATLVAVLIAFRKKIVELFRHPTSPKARFLAIATLPTAAVAAAIRYLMPDVASF
ncbi:MAG: undecaprenyl-diphosphate phosphatase [Clostridia bacterium]|nr:undecaprenyl-diphosphate phosphatase [Clostridia bacterium]